MTTKLHQHWMTEPPTRAVMAALDAAGGEPRFVGGCVRNALMAREVADIDIATPLTPDAVIVALTAAGLKAIPTGIDHGTVTAVADGKPFEVTTLRKDVATDGRHAVVAFTTDWAEDASRRDFTINALYADAGGHVFDPTGDGLRDLAARRVRFIGDPGARIREDYLRILRFFRIHAWYGEGSMDEAGLAACAAHTAGLSQLSGERIQKEMLKLLSAEEPVAALRAMAATGVLGAVLPGPLNIPRLEAMAAIERDTFSDPDGVLRLAALLTGAGSQNEGVAERWRLSNKDAARIGSLNAVAVPKIVPYLSIKEVRRTLYRIGADRFVDFCRLRWAEDKKPSNQMNWRAMIAMAQSWAKPALPLTGHQLMQAGVPPGPEVGRVLAEVEEWWIDADFTDDEFSIIERLKAIVQASHWA
jgi:poly(A) polymerase